MPFPVGFFEIAVGSALIVAAIVALSVRDRLTAVVAFVAVGGLLALLWNVERAPDIALAEAAIGTGVTCALFVDAVMRQPRTETDRQPRTETDRRGRTARRVLVAGTGSLCAAITVGLAGAAISASDAGVPLLPDEVAAAMTDTAADHEVTAVLLDFRSYDTLLEVSIVLVAAVGALALAERSPRFDSDHDLGLADDPPLRDAMNLLTPILVLLAAWILFAGAYRPGGAFQAAAVLTGAAVLTTLTGRRLGMLDGARGRTALGIGIVVFLVAAAWGALTDGAWLAMSGPWAAAVTIGVEVALTLSISAALTLIFLSIARGAGRIGDRR